ncbi:hypothetical protein ACI2K4_34665 [Micromonospora sp. NPDC050397]|uniref:hypothetical protein n=1 Tax=Micromonospora sp. NPDC050397 TaxID=3364279 RepID=UPI00384ACF4B
MRPSLIPLAAAAFARSAVRAAVLGAAFAGDERRCLAVALTPPDVVRRTDDVLFRAAEVDFRAAVEVDFRAAVEVDFRAVPEVLLRADTAPVRADAVLLRAGLVRPDAVAVRFAGPLLVLAEPPPRRPSERSARESACTRSPLRRAEMPVIPRLRS